MYLRCVETKLKINDIAIFRANDGVIQFMRGSQRLLNKLPDNKTIVSTQLPLCEFLCSNIANIIAITHGFEVQNISGIYKNRDLFHFRFIGAKKEKRPKRQNISSSEIEYRLKIKKS